VNKAGILTAQVEQFKLTLAVKVATVLDLVLVALPWQLWQPLAYKVMVLVLVVVELTAMQHPQQVEVESSFLRHTKTFA
jgi:hypothetical protein